MADEQIPSNEELEQHNQARDFESEPSGAAFRNVRTKLSLQEEAFCLEYCKYFNGRQSAIKAGYAEGNASKQAVEMLARPRIQGRIKELQEQRARQYDVTVERVIEEWSKIAFVDLTRLVAELGGTLQKVQVKTLHEIPVELRAAIKGIKPTKYGIEISFYEKTTALEALSRYLGIYGADNQQKTPAGVGIYLPDNGRGDLTPPANGSVINKPKKEL